MTSPRGSPCALRAAALLLLVPGAAPALPPDQVFEKASPSIWSVRGLDANERPLNIGSAVVIGPERLVTACRVLARAKSVQIRRENAIFDAILEHPDVERDLCALYARGLAAPAAQVGSIQSAKVGQRVYAISIPQKLSLTLGEGLISGLRAEDPKLPPVQTSVPHAPGMEGGGLFDADARLIGILARAPSSREMQAIGFALPADWIAEIPARAALALAKRSEPAPSGGASSALPATGSSWKYAYADQKYGGRQEFVVRVTGLDGWTVNESLAVAGAASETPGSVGSRDTTFIGRALSGGKTFSEFTPYLLSASEGKVPAEQIVAAGYPADTNGTWTVSVAVRDWESTSVPAGTYRALRVDVTGNRAVSATWAGMVAARFAYTAWYAPDIKRYVKIRHQVWSRNSTPTGDDSVELLEYRGN